MPAASTSVRAELYRIAPEVFQDQLRDWIEHGIEPHDDLLHAILANDLGSVVSHAAEEPSCFTLARATLMWLWNGAPARCYGSPGHIEAWHRHRGEAGE